ncbi:MAG TPA: sugar transferase [Bacteroidota bacterium]|nr:sugar transferase [Bacteroidota bacterium]
MKSIRENIPTIIVDFIAINIVWSVYYWIRVRSGWLTYSMEPDFMIPMIAVCLFWILIYFFFGLYRSWHLKSRLDEFIAIFKATSFGVLILFFAIFVDDRGIGSPLHARFQIAIYWLLMVIFIGSGRFIQHTFQRRLLIAGVGLRNTLIVGFEEKAKELFKTLQQYPALGYKVIGFVPVGGGSEYQVSQDTPIVGGSNELPELINRYRIQDVIIALDSTDHDKLLDIIALCNSHDVSMKIIPDLYDMISGQSRTNQIYGLPLIEIMPELMPTWERAVKRALDILISATVLLLGLPIWLLVALAIKLDSKGAIFYTQERVGRDEKHFRIIKYRSMFESAEQDSGPVWADKEDPRITRVGRVLRSLRLDEIPQLINVLEGDMSLVGPRPERPYFVEQLSKEIPLYKRRLKVRPGITGWAQVKLKYDESIDDVRKKVQYDLSYIENMSLRMDFKILFNTIIVVLLGKGR